MRRRDDRIYMIVKVVKNERESEKKREREKVLHHTCKKYIYVRTKYHI